MAEPLDHIEYLSKEIGPRPAGTEEEQKAALYIADQLQNESGFSATVEDFTSSSNFPYVRAVCGIVSVVMALLALIAPAVTIVSFILSALAAVVFTLESTGNPVVTRLLARGASQNVVAKYSPNEEGGRGSRSRKVVLVAHYDTGKVESGLARMLNHLGWPLQKIYVGGMIAVPVLLLIDMLFFSGSSRMPIVLVVLTIIAIIVCVVPVVVEVLNMVAPYNEGANDNASGVAVMLDVARRIGEGSFSEAELGSMEDQAVIHGEQAAREGGVVPPEAELVYETAATYQESPEEPANADAPVADVRTAEQRLASAKAAIAAFTGESDAEWVDPEIEEQRAREAAARKERLSQAVANGGQGAQEASGEEKASVAYEGANAGQAGAANSQAQPAAANAPAQGASAFGWYAAPAAPTAPVQEDKPLPSWYVAAQRKAKRPVSNEPIHRSRYADALDSAVSKSSAYFDEANRLMREERQKIEQAHASDIVEVAPPAAESRPAAAAVVQPAGAYGAPQSTDARTMPVAPAQTQPGAVAAPADAGSQAMQDEPVEVEASVLPSDEEVAEAEAQPGVAVGFEAVEETFERRGVSMPAFLDPWKVQAETLEEREEISRTTDRVNVTGARIDPSGRVDINDGGYLEDAETVADRDEESRTLGRTGSHAPVVLPDVPTGSAQAAPVVQKTQQRAPLADAQEEGGKKAAKDLLNQLPSISVGSSDQSQDPLPSHSGAMRSLRAKLPSLSGSIQPVDGDVKVSSVSTVGSFVAAGATGSFEPVGDELLDDVEPEDVYIDDADDSDVEENYTESGAFAGPGYVEMPKSRMGRLFGKFHLGKKHDEELEESPQEWLDVDDEFDPRDEGARRGGWESFQDESAEYAQSSDETQYADDDDLGATTEYHPDQLYDQDQSQRNGGKANRTWQGGGFSRVRLGRVDTKSTSESDAEEFAEATGENVETPTEIKQIYQFRNPDYNTEVWFVALGSQIGFNDGVQAFVNEHANELRGAIIVELQALGAGELSLVSEEGGFKQVKTSSRIKRFTKKASTDTGVSVGTAKIDWMDGAAAYCIKNGLQGVHLVGMDNGAIALSGSADDTAESIDQQTLKDNARYIATLVKEI